MGPLGICRRETRHIGTGAGKGIDQKGVVKRVVRAPVTQLLRVVVTDLANQLAVRDDFFGMNDQCLDETELCRCELDCVSVETNDSCGKVNREVCQRVCP